MVAISLFWLISNTTKRPTTSEFLQLFRTSAKFFQSAFFAILYQAFRDALHSRCSAAASRIAFRLTTRMTNLRIMRSWRQPEISISPRNSAPTGQAGRGKKGAELAGGEGVEFGGGQAFKKDGTSIPASRRGPECALAEITDVMRDGDLSSCL